MPHIFNYLATPITLFIILLLHRRMVMKRTVVYETDRIVFLLTYCFFAMSLVGLLSEFLINRPMVWMAVPIFILLGIAVLIWGFTFLNKDFYKNNSNNNSNN